MNTGMKKNSICIDKKGFEVYNIVDLAGCTLKKLITKNDRQCQNNKKEGEILMMKSKRLLCLILSAVMVAFSMTACATENNNPGTNDDGGSTTTSGAQDPGTDDEGGNTDDASGDDETGDGETANEIVVDYDDEAIYDDVLGEFYDTYADGKAETEDVAKRFALMAIAEAKMMEAAVMMPMQANGGNYAISKVAPYTISPVLWGNDSDRYHNAIVATEPITTEDRDALKALYAELKGTHTYEAAVVDYLTEHGYEIQRSYSLGYNSDPQTYDIFMSSMAVDAEVLVNTYDGLLEYDGENNLNGALAESWDVSDDGLVWTFNLRKGAQWVDSTGANIAEVTADDFVAGFQHMLDDPEGGLSWLVDGVIAGDRKSVV